MTENISAFVDFHIKALAVKHFSYLQDTPDFLRLLETEVNNGDALPANTIIATIDVCGLYTNIPMRGGSFYRKVGFEISTQGDPILWYLQIPKT